MTDTLARTAAANEAADAMVRFLTAQGEARAAWMTLGRLSGDFDAAWEQTLAAVTRSRASACPHAATSGLVAGPTDGLEPCCTFANVWVRIGYAASCRIHP